MTDKAWKDLDGHDWIVCPRDQIPERVVRSKAYVAGKRAVRTTRHDHFRPSTERVEVVPAPSWAK